MATREFRLPDPGEGLTEAEIVEWKVAVGDTVKVNDIVVEIETAKSLVELPVPFAGTVVALLVAEGETVEVGTPIIAVDTGGDDEPGPAPAAEPSTAAAAAVASELAATTTGAAPQAERTAVLVGYGVKQTEAKRRPRHTVAATTPEEHVVPVASARPGQLVAAHATEVPVATPEPSLRHPAGTPSAKVRAKPPVRKYAKDHGVDLTAIPGTGPDGVITRADVDALLGGGDGAAALAPAGMPSAARPRGETRTPIKGVRKVTAQAMVGSAFTAPHVTEWVTVDVTRTVELVERLKGDREFKGVKVTPLLVLAKAMCLAVRRHPQINATWDEAQQQIVVKDYVNLGIAAATPRGLLVPNVKDADLMSMRELAEAIGALDGDRPGGPHPAGRDVRWHHHPHQRRDVRCRHRDADPQPRRGRHRRVRGDPQAAVGRHRR